MSDQTANVRAANPDNYQVSERISLWVRPRGSTSPADWRELGNIADHSIEGIKSYLDHFSHRRGARAKDKSIITERGGTLAVTVDEVNRDNLMYAFGATGTPVADTVDLLESKTLKNEGVGNAITLGETDLVVGSVIVRGLDLEEEVTYVVDTDYTVDEVAGTITPKAGGALADTVDVPRVHIFWRKNVESQSFELFPETEVEIEVQFQCLPEGGLKWVSKALKAILKNAGAISFGDGSEYVKIPLQIEFLIDDNGDVGRAHIINADELP